MNNEPLPAEWQEVLCLCDFTLSCTSIGEENTKSCMQQEESLELCLFSGCSLVHSLVSQWEIWMMGFFYGQYLRPRDLIFKYS